MFMRITWFKLRSNAWDAYVCHYNEAIRDAPGLLGRWLTRNELDQTEIYAVSLWRDRDALRNWESSAPYLHEFLPTIQPLLASVMTVSACEVLAFEQSGASDCPRGSWGLASPETQTS